MKVSDFGFASSKGFSQLKTKVCSGSYCCPEIWEKSQYDGKKADVFSAGVILYFTVTGKLPWDYAKKNDGIYGKIKRNLIDNYFTSQDVDYLSPEFKDLFIKMVTYDVN